MLFNVGGFWDLRVEVVARGSGHCLLFAKGLCVYQLVMGDMRGCTQSSSSSSLQVAKI